MMPFQKEMKYRRNKENQKKIRHQSEIGEVKQIGRKYAQTVNCFRLMHKNKQEQKKESPQSTKSDRQDFPGRETNTKTTDNGSPPQKREKTHKKTHEFSLHKKKKKINILGLIYRQEAIFFI